MTVSEYIAELQKLDQDALVVEWHCYPSSFYLADIPVEPSMTKGLFEIRAKDSRVRIGTSRNTALVCICEIPEQPPKP